MLCWLLFLSVNNFWKIGRISLSSNSLSDVALYMDLSRLGGHVAVLSAATLGVDWKYPSLLHCWLHMFVTSFLATGDLSRFCECLFLSETDLCMCGSSSSCEMLTLLVFWCALAHLCWLPVSHSSLLATTCVPHSVFFLGVVRLLGTLTRRWQTSSCSGISAFMLVRRRSAMCSRSRTRDGRRSCVGVLPPFFGSGSSTGGFSGGGGADTSPFCVGLSGSGAACAFGSSFSCLGESPTGLFFFLRQTHLNRAPSTSTLSLTFDCRIGAAK
jgi:hypothetical protein